jgi:potassium/hydrogen antiporter
MIPIEHLLVAAALFLTLSIVASKIAVKSGVPALLLFLIVGMAAGSEGIGGIYFDDPWLTQFIGVIALVFILFSGGLDTAWQEIRPILSQGIVLSTVGVLLTAVAVGWLMHTFFGFSLAEGLLLGSIISSTDAAAVFSVLRGKNVNLKGRLKALLELESGSNDPMAVFLTLGMIQLVLNPSLPVTSLLPMFVVQMGIGAVSGFIFGRVIQFIINRLHLEYDGLYPVLSIALVGLTYGFTTTVGGNGFLAVYLAGLVLGNCSFIHKRSLLRFHDGIAWLMQIAMFLTLGLQVFPSQLTEVSITGLIVAIFLIFLARPLSVFLSLALSRLNIREKLFISWVGLRGAAPIILGTFPLLAGIEKADTIFNLVFFIVLTSVLLQGTLIIPVAKGLQVYSKESNQSPSPMEFVMSDGRISNDLIELTVSENALVVGKQILDLQLPESTLIVLIGRKNEMIVPGGGTVIEAGDRILLLVREAARESVTHLLQHPQPMNVGV